MAHVLIIFFHQSESAKSSSINSKPAPTTPGPMPTGTKCPFMAHAEKCYELANPSVREAVEREAAEHKREHQQCHKSDAAMSSQPTAKADARTHLNSAFHPALKQQEKDHASKPGREKHRGKGARAALREDLRAALLALRRTDRQMPSA
ncbi:unnamed protein product [Peniophora sp. CBMAI 1063]|nr:unnamed protein product [Peniophora sp. CBMAI 1063]